MKEKNKNLMMLFGKRMICLCSVCFANMQQPLKMYIDSGKIVIEVGLEFFARAASTSPGWPHTMKITDPLKFAEAAFRELSVEREDGSTLITEAFDRAAMEALESGAPGVEHAAVN